MTDKDISELESEIAEILEDLPEDKRSTAISMLFANSTTHYQGPLPPPEFINYYESKVPGAVERMLKMAEHEMQHRHVIEKQMIEVDSAQAKRGSLFGFCAFIFLMLALVSAIYIGNDVAVVAISGLGITGIIGHFVNSHKE